MGRKYHLNDIKRYRMMMRPAWPQKELAERVGCSQSDISAYERGAVMPSLEVALRIARAFGRVIEEVFFGLAEATHRDVSRTEAESASGGEPSEA